MFGAPRKPSSRNPGSSHRDRLETVSDEMLVNRILSGNGVAFEVLMLRYRGVLTGYLYGKIPANVDPEDLFQEIYLAVYKNLAKLQKSNRFGPWLIAIARHKLHDLYRSRAASSLRGEHVELTETIDPCGAARASELASPESEDLHHLKRVVTEVIGELPGVYRLVLVMRLFEEMTLVEIAQRLGIREVTARVRLHRGIAKVRKKLERLGISPANIFT